MRTGEFSVDYPQRIEYRECGVGRMRSAGKPRISWRGDVRQWELAEFLRIAHIAEPFSRDAALREFQRNILETQDFDRFNGR